MPSYTAHTIMARDVYKKLKNKKDVSLDYMLTYSLGGDLTNFAKCRHTSHNKNREEFFNTLCKYAKDNNLNKDPEIIGLIYGHICHYALDDMAHPLVRKLAKKAKGKRSHYHVEDNFDKYLVSKKYHTDVNKYDNKVLFKGKVTKKIKNILDYAYEKNYNEKHLSRYYKFNIFLYKKIKYLYIIPGIKLYRKITGFTKFLKLNKSIDLLNNNHETTFKIDGKERNDSLKDLYDKSIEKALKDIEKINKKLK